MPSRSPLPRLAAALLAFAGVGLSAQTPAPASGARAPATRTAAVRPVLPDPELFDGSALEAEPRPDSGMLAEFELPGSEERPEQMAVRNAGENPQQQQQQMGGGGGSPSGQQAGQGGARPSSGGDPNAKAEGIAVAELQVDEGSASQDAVKPREISIGDTAMQIPVATAQQSVIGSQPQSNSGQQQGVSNSQQYEKGAAAGRQTGNNQNRGLEKGRNIPEGL